MGRAKAATKSTPTPTNLASLIRGLYGRVARQLKVDPSYVSRVARGERQSQVIEASLERELRRIMTTVRSHHFASKNGTSRTRTRSAKKSRA